MRTCCCLRLGLALLGHVFVDTQACVFTYAKETSPNVRTCYILRAVFQCRVRNERPSDEVSAVGSCAIVNRNFGASKRVPVQAGHVMDSSAAILILFV